MNKDKEIISLVIRINTLTINIERQTINLHLLEQQVKNAVKNLGKGVAKNAK